MKDAKQTDPGGGGKAESSSTSTTNNSPNSALRVLGATDNTTKAFHRSKWLFTVFILVLGGSTSAACLALGISGTDDKSERRFRQGAYEFTQAVVSAWHDYELFGNWIHESCFRSFNRSEIPMQADLNGHLGICSRQEFHRLYEHIAAVGLGFKALQFLVNISHSERQDLEEESRLYYQDHYPNVSYLGITHVDFSDGVKKRVPAEDKQFYFPVHYAEPVVDNEFALDLDAYNPHNTYIDKAVSMWEPVLSTRIVPFGESDPNAYTIVLLHPGIRDSSVTAPRPVALARILIRMPSFLESAAIGSIVSKSVYLFDSTDSGSSPEYLGAARVRYPDLGPSVIPLPEVEMSDIARKSSTRFFQNEIPIAGRRWTIVVTSDEYNPDLAWVIIGASMIFASSLLLAAWFHYHLGRVAKMNQIRSEAEAAKAESARSQALRERELNEFIAHEVRNPLSSAISALSFIKAGVAEPFLDDSSRTAILNDIRTADSSLQFINELLRNMLDMHRAASKQMKLDLGPTDVSRDVLEPVASILFMRGAKVDILTDCPKELFVKSDRMRLKQIILNLSANATKFVQEGYIRLRASVVDESVELSVEDSGPGIPPAKRDRLFAKFQESLDSLNQGTGIGLSVCKNLSELLGADIWLDEAFDSGVPECPGSRFVIRLNQPVLDMDSRTSADLASEQAGTQSNPAPPESAGQVERVLPDMLSVLFVDDDTVLRKMFTRALRRVAPKWDIQEASNGETALRMVDTHHFHIIFVDQYMASIEKQLLGTETVLELRSKGISSIICGLSANDLKDQFIEAGANTFMSKPFPCEEVALRTEILRILELRD